MSFRSRFRVLVVCVAMQVGVLTGVPMLPDDIRELMNQMSRPKLAHVLPADDDGNADPPADDSRGRRGPPTAGAGRFTRAACPRRQEILVLMLRWWTGRDRGRRRWRSVSGRFAENPATGCRYFVAPTRTHPHHEHSEERQEGKCIEQVAGERQGAETVPLHR
jgi:hypothetical protein